MKSISRSLSFSRRRSKSKTPSGDVVEAAPAAADGLLAPLCDELIKRHESSHTGATDKRWFEVDDTLGVLYQFKGRTELERRTPYRVHALGALQRAEVVESNGVKATIFSLKLCSSRLAASRRSSTSTHTNPRFAINGWPGSTRDWPAMGRSRSACS
jgi:hypothetical protein